MAARVGIISDTHDLLRPEVVEILKDCDYILHAGDVTREKLLDQIRNFGRLYVVRGNNDGAWARGISVRLRFKIEDVEFLMVHDKRDVGEKVSEADVIVYGHSHQYAEKMIDGRLWLNPGSCGYPRFGGAVSMVVMDIDHDQYKIKKILL